MSVCNRPMVHKQGHLNAQAGAVCELDALGKNKYGSP